MLFIKYVLNYDFRKRTFCRSINIVPGITNTTQNLCKISFMQKSMMNSLCEIITNVLLVRPLYWRSIIVQRVKNMWMIKTTIQRILVNLRKTKETSIRRANSKSKVQEKARNLSSAIVVVVLIILQISTIYPNTWSTRRLEKLNDHLKFTSMLHPMKQRLQERSLMKLKNQA
jgi:hypothetical protein